MKTLLIMFVFSILLSAGVYDYGYHPLRDVNASEQRNALFQGDFERIVRYDPLVFAPSDPIKLDDKFREYAAKIYESIGAYTAAGVPYTVHVIAHTRSNNDEQFEAVQKSTFFGSLQNSLMESRSNTDENKAVCDRVLSAAKKQLVDNHVEEKNIVIECRSGYDPLYLENDGDAREMNYYLNVTLYQSK